MIEKQIIETLKVSMDELVKILKEESKYAEASLLVFSKLPEIKPSPKEIVEEKLNITIKRSREMIRDLELIFVGLEDVVNVNNKYQEMEVLNDMKMKKWLRENNMPEW
jgi:hypothetical protein